MNCHVPVDTAKRALGANKRRFRAVGSIHPAVIQAAVVTHEELVDILVRTRLEPDHRGIPGLDGDVAALRAARTNGSDAVQLPGARLVQEILREQCTDRTEVDDIASPRMREILSFELSDERPIAALADIEDRIMRDVVHEAHASSAENASVRNVKNVAPEVLDRVETLRIAIP